MKPDYTEGRPASRLDPDPLFVDEEHRQEAARAERNVWLGLAATVIVVALLGAVALVLIAGRGA